MNQVQHDLVVNEKNAKFCRKCYTNLPTSKDDSNLNILPRLYKNFSSLVYALTLADKSNNYKYYKPQNLDRYYAAAYCSYCKECHGGICKYSQEVNCRNHKLSEALFKVFNKYEKFCIINCKKYKQCTQFIELFEKFDRKLNKLCCKYDSNHYTRCTLCKQFL